MSAFERWVEGHKATTTLALLFLVLIEAAMRGTGLLGTVAITVAVAALADGAVLWARGGRLVVPDGAVITALLTSMVVDPQAGALAPAVSSLAGLAAKHAIRTRWSNVFNPAAVALLFAHFAFGSPQSWWGGLADLAPGFIVVLVAVGALIADRENKLPLVLAFLGVYTVAMTAVALVAPDRVASAFRVPDLNAALFLAFLMLTDPPTSPVRYGHQVAFGAIAAVISAGALLLGAGIYHFPLAVVGANAWESWRRLSARVAEPARA